jgi:uncharacterized protein
MKRTNFIGLLLGFLLLADSSQTALAVQVEKSSNSSPSNPVEDRVTPPPELVPQSRPSAQSIKNKIALQLEINILAATVDKAKTSTSVTKPSSQAQQRQNNATAQGQRLSANAAWVLGLMAANGLGMEQDLAQAQLHFKHAQTLGEPLAAAGLAWCAIQGCEVLPSARDARAWIAKLKPVSAGRAFYLEWLVETTFSPLQANSADSAQELVKAMNSRRQLLLNAAKSKDVQALIELGFEAVAAEREKEAQRYFEAAAGQSKTAANNALLVQSRQTDRKALCQVTNAAELPDSVLLSSAQALHRGDSCSVNYIEAIRLYNLAANKGNTSAKRMLALIYSKPEANGGVNITWMQQLAQINAITLSTQLEVTALATKLRREPTALFDMIPQYLRDLAQ